MAPDDLEVLRTQRKKAAPSRAVRADPLQIGIACRIELGQGVAGPLEQPVRHRAVHVIEAAAVSSETAHHRLRKEQVERQTPTPRIPRRRIELLRGRVRCLHATSPRYSDGLHQRQNAFAEERKVALEAARGPDASPRSHPDANPRRAARIPTGLTTAPIEPRSTLTRPGANELQQLAITSATTSQSRVSRLSPRPLRLPTPRARASPSQQPTRMTSRRPCRTRASSTTTPQRPAPAR